MHALGFPEFARLTSSTSYRRDVRSAPIKSLSAIEIVEETRAPMNVFFSPAGIFSVEFPRAREGEIITIDLPRISADVDAGTKLRLVSFRGGATFLLSSSRYFARANQNSRAVRRSREDGRVAGFERIFARRFVNPVVRDHVDVCRHFLATEEPVRFIFAR